jgi:acetyl-CoA carboxylase biotin carboxyl carrier protein
MTLSELKELIELVAEKGFAEFEVERSGFKLRIVANTAHALGFTTAPGEHGADGAAPVAPRPAASAASLAPQAAAAALPEPAPEEPAADDSLYIIKSPIVGTFYRSSSPTSEPFVKVGDNIDVGSVLCIVEAMKLMNEIESDTAGEVVKIFVENGQPVEYGQPLFGIRG